MSKAPSSGDSITFTHTATERQQMTYGSEVASYTQYDNRDRLRTKSTLQGLKRSVQEVPTKRQAACFLSPVSHAAHHRTSRQCTSQRRSCNASLES